jgi:predicted transcriptional regulator
MLFIIFIFMCFFYYSLFYLIGRHIEKKKFLKELKKIDELEKFIKHYDRKNEEGEYMKSVLISIQPKWCELIASGKKTIEVRKTRPKIEVPFKCYIYETKDAHFEHIGVHYADGQDFIHHIGKVIGEFVCDKMLESFLNNNDGWFIEKGCLTQKEIEEYQGEKAILYGWHISNLVIYDKPRELCEFVYASTVHTNCFGKHTKRVTRPPQSWLYVEGE